jgi:Tol biopolymer transport system component
VRLRSYAAAAASLAACATLAGCGGAGKPRPDLIFVSSRTGVYDIYAMNADGSRQQRLTHGSSGNASSPQGLFYEIDPAWSRDGRRIAFASARTGGFENVFAMDADGKNVRQLTVSADESTQPTWSPDGRQIAFVRGRLGRIFVMSSTGRGAHSLTRGAAVESDPAWSPNGRWIAYARITPHTPVREIWIVHPDGSDAHQITTLAASTEEPTWSPDSRKLAFSSDAREGTFAIYTIGVGGTGLKLVARTASDAVAPAWSPDGKTIAFSSGGAIETVDLAGKVTQLTDGKNNDSNPAWKPLIGGSSAK